MNRVEAELVEWNDQRGFGFARLPGGTERIFVHIKSVNKGQKRPEPGDALQFEVRPGRNGKPAAHAVDVAVPGGEPMPLALHLATAGILVLVLNLGLILTRVPLWLAAIYALMSGISMVLYAWDKRAAMTGMFRVSEIKIQTVDLAGGIIGGLVAQHMFRHKRSKESFQAVTVATVLIHAILLGGLTSGVFASVWIALGLPVF